MTKPNKSNCEDQNLKQKSAHEKPNNSNCDKTKKKIKY